MSVNLITGYAGEAHITAEGDGAVNYGMYGSGKYVLNVGETFDYEIISNNLIQVKSGYAIDQGRKIELAVNDYEELEIDNGLQGVKRCDLIVIHYEKNLTTGIETATMEVIKGTSGDDYVDPEYTSGDIISGANEDDFLLYRIKIDGLSIDSVEALFTVTDSLLDLLATKDTEIADLKSLLGSSTLTTTAKTCTEAINELDDAIEEANTNLDTHKTSSDHDSRYYTKTQNNSLLANKQDALSISNITASINTGRFLDDDSSWITVRQYGKIAICNFNIITNSENAMNTTTAYTIATLSKYALYTARGIAFTSGNFSGELYISSDSLNQIKVRWGEAIAAGAAITLRGQIVFLID